MLGVNGLSFQLFVPRQNFRLVPATRSTQQRQNGGRPRSNQSRPRGRRRDSGRARSSSQTTEEAVRGQEDGGQGGRAAGGPQCEHRGLERDTRCEAPFNLYMRTPY
jgi:hypothetical protein